jgi:hypothetical protein
MGTRKKPTKNTTGKPRKPPADIAEKLDPEYREKDFDAALERATRRLDEADPRGRGSSRR